MHPKVRRDVINGGAVVAFGLGLLGCALFGGDESFRAPRWAVAAAAIGFIVGGYVPLRHAHQGAILRVEGKYPLLGVSVALFVLFLASVWVVVAMGPEGTAVTLDVPLPVSEAAERWIRSVIFYGLFGVGAVALFAGSMYTMNRAIPNLGRTTFIAIVAPAAGLMAWIGIEIQLQN